MHTNGNNTEIVINDNDKKAFEECIKKIIKGLFFKKFNKYLDLENEYTSLIVWNTINLEYDIIAKNQVQKFLELFGDQPFKGNEVFKFRYHKTEDGSSYLWEFLFYDRFPVYVFLIHKDDKMNFKSLK